MSEVEKLNSVIRWGLHRSRHSREQGLRKHVLGLLKLIDFSKISAEEVAKYIEPYDIFDSEEYHQLIANKVASS